MFLEKIKNLLNSRYRDSVFIKILVSPVASVLQTLNEKIHALYCNFFFYSLTEDGCKYFESLLGLTVESGDTLENRRAKIQARWLSNNHNSITLIRAICGSWNDGEAVADFVGGKIRITFTKTIGTPTYLDSMIKSINLVKPAHIPILLVFRYLIIEEIHEVKTIEEMENLTLDMFYSE